MNNNLIFLDLETTGLDTSKCEVIECAYTATGDNEKVTDSSLFLPHYPIPPEVSGVTNIDNSDVAHLDNFKGSKMLQDLKVFAEAGYIAVTHNTDFDLGVLEAHGVKFEQSICTLSLGRHLYPKLANHKLGTLRAFFKIPHGGEAHRAEYDVDILIKVARAMFSQWKTSSPDQIIPTAIHLTQEAQKAYIETWQFGKYKGEKINSWHHKGYVQWVLENSKTLSPKLRAFLEQLLKS
jgi:DNA polymerase III alpha subunit (gram-positive type)